MPSLAFVFHRREMPWGLPEGLRKERKMEQFSLSTSSVFLGFHEKLFPHCIGRVLYCGYPFTILLKLALRACWISVLFVFAKQAFIPQRKALLCYFLLHLCISSLHDMVIVDCHIDAHTRALQVTGLSD